MPVDTQKIFALFSDSNNKLPANDILRALYCAGCIVNQDSIEKCDMDYASFNELVQKHLLCNREQMESLFRTFDPKDTGYIKANDLKNILMAGDSPLTDGEIKDFFERAAPNDEGMVCYTILIDHLYKDTQ